MHYSYSSHTYWITTGLKNHKIVQRYPILWRGCCSCYQPRWLYMHFHRLPSAGTTRSNIQREISTRRRPLHEDQLSYPTSSRDHNNCLQSFHLWRKLLSTNITNMACHFLELSYFHFYIDENTIKKKGKPYIDLFPVIHSPETKL